MPFPTLVWDGDSGSRDTDDGSFSAPDHRDWHRLISELRETQQKILADIAEGIGDTEIFDGLSVNEVGNNALHRTTLTFTDLVMDITDAGAAGAHGSVKLYTFPSDTIHIFNNVLLVAVATGSGGISNNANLDIAIGSDPVGTGNDVLSLLEQNISTKIDLSLTGGSKAGSVLNSTSGCVDTPPIELYLNVAIEEADCNANDTLTTTGRTTLLWSNCPIT